MHEWGGSARRAVGLLVNTNKGRGSAAQESPKRETLRRRKVNINKLDGPPIEQRREKTGKYVTN